MCYSSGAILALTHQYTRKAARCWQISIQRSLECQHCKSHAEMIRLERAETKGTLTALFSPDWDDFQSKRLLRCNLKREVTPSHYAKNRPFWDSILCLLTSQAQNELKLLSRLSTEKQVLDGSQAGHPSGRAIAEEKIRPNDCPRRWRGLVHDS